MSSLLDRVIEHEGFEPKPYQCSEDVWTFGHGLTFITEAESLSIVAERLDSISKALVADFPWLRQRPDEVLDVTTEMTFQLGLTGCKNFRNMWSALYNEDYNLAAAEGLDSKWHLQTPTRAQSLMSIIRGLA